MEGDRVALTYLLSLLNASSLPSLEEAFSSSFKRLEELEQVCAAQCEFNAWKKKVETALAEALVSELPLALHLGVTEYTHIMHLEEKEAGRVCVFAKNSLQDYASDSDPKSLSKALGHLLDMTMLFGIEFSDLEKACEKVIRSIDSPMRWSFVGADKETDHPFLNYYVFHYDVMTPQGRRDYKYFVASRNDEDHLLAKEEERSRPDGVIMVLFVKGDDGKKRLVMTKQFRPAINRYVYSLPAGLMDEGDETIEDTARREALEESGAILGDIKVIVPPSPTSEGLSDELDCFVMADVIDVDKNRLEAFEDISSKSYSKEEFQNLMARDDVMVPLPLRCLSFYIIENWPE